MWRKDQRTSRGNGGRSERSAPTNHRPSAVLLHLWPPRLVRQSLSTHSTTKVTRVISPETRVQIRRYFYAEHWKIGTIAQQLGLHADTVRLAIETERFHPAEQLRASILDPYLEFVRQTLDQYPQLRATRLHQMIGDRGYTATLAVSSSCGAPWPACGPNGRRHSSAYIPSPPNKLRPAGRTSAT